MAVFETKKKAGKTLFQTVYFSILIAEILASRFYFISFSVEIPRKKWYSCPCLRAAVPFEF